MRPTGENKGIIYDNFSVAGAESHSVEGGVCRT